MRSVNPVSSSGYWLSSSSLSPRSTRLMSLATLRSGVRLQRSNNNCSTISITPRIDSHTTSVRRVTAFSPSNWSSVCATITVRPTDFFRSVSSATP